MYEFLDFIQRNGYQIVGGMLSLALAIIYLKRSLVEIKSTLAEVKTRVICDLSALQADMKIHKALIEQNTQAIANMEALNRSIVSLTERICVLEERVSSIKTKGKKR